MTILDAYIAERNVLRRLFNQPEFAQKGTLSGHDAASLYFCLDGDLAPEVLTADGEASTDFVRRRGAFLRNAVRELDALGFHRPPDVFGLPEQRAA